MNSSEFTEARQFAGDIKRGTQLKAEQRRQEALDVHRRILAEHLESLTQAFEGGVSTEQLVHERSRLMDMILTDIWNLIFHESSDITLVAVGGYGRGELHPCSDIDILILLKEDNLQAYQTHIERFITFLWDLRLEVGHSVRTPAECAKQAEADVTVVTNLLESRILTGTENLFHEMKRLTAENRIWSRDDFFDAKLAEQRKRHAKFDDTAYQLEPNLKEGPGGLRDLQTVGWVAKRYFDTETLSDIFTLGFIDEDELTTLLRSREFLWKLRFGLHIITRRHEDRLTFSHQRELAALLGFVDNDHNLAVEQMMQRYFATVTELQRLNEILLQVLAEAIHAAKHLPKTIDLDDHFCIRNQQLQVRYEQVFVQQPGEMLRVFLLLQREDVAGIGAYTIRLLRTHRNLIDDQFRSSPENKALFLQMLREPQGITKAFTLMNRYGVLAAYLPAFENIVGRMQFDLFHVYTVDVHTLFVLRNIRHYACEEHADKHPLGNEVFARLEHPEILYIAGLFHDIGKGRGGDHSKLGAQDAKTFCDDHGLSQTQAQLVSWLVENHLVLSMTSQRQDISDPEVIKQFAERVKTTERLDYLYLLTVADSRATNPKLWNSWRDRLLKELYLRTRRVIRRSATSESDVAIQVDQRREMASQMLFDTGMTAMTIDQVWQHFNDEYFLRHNSEEIAWQTKAIHDINAPLPLVLISRTAPRGGTPIFIYAKDNDGFFAVTTTVISRLGLNIVDARILTSMDNHTLNTYIVLDHELKPIKDPQQIKTLQETLTYYLSHPDELPEASLQPVRRQLKEFHRPSQVTVENDDMTLLGVVAVDQAGLLSVIGQTFEAHDIRVHNAKIMTVSHNAENWFTITRKQDNQPLNEHEADQLKEALELALDGINQ